MTVTPTDTDERTSGRVAAPQDDALGDDDGVALVARVAAGEVTPTELATAAIARAEAVEPSINAIVTADYERALATAAASPSGALAGLPMFIKDMTPIQGLPTTYGSRSMIDSSPAVETGDFAKMFEAFGTVLLGTSSMPEYGLTCTTEVVDAPPTRNPWNLAHSVGGSSGGAGALVAAGVLPMATSADGGGSTRIPASVNGLVGLKPTRERLVGGPDDAKMPINLVTYGVVTRTVRDTCAFFAAAEGYHHNNRLPPMGLVDRPLDRPLRIGVVDSSPANSTLDGPTHAALAATGDLLASLGHSVESVALPVDGSFTDDFVLYWASAALSLQLGGKKLIHPEFQADRLTPFTQGLAHHAKRHAWRIPGAIRRLRKASAMIEQGLGRNDLLLSPTMGHLTPEIGHLSLELSFDEHMERMAPWAAFTPLANVTGTPALSLPLGHDEDHNLPIGMHFMARFGQDRLLLELALQLEAAQPFRRNTPDD